MLQKERAQETGSRRGGAHGPRQVRCVEGELWGGGGQGEGAAAAGAALQLQHEGHHLLQVQGGEQAHHALLVVVLVLGRCARGRGEEEAAMGSRGEGESERNTPSLLPEVTQRNKKGGKTDNLS